MIKPSEKSLNLAEELLDYVHPGMPRAAALQEVAQMADDMNSELVDSISALLAELEKAGPGEHAVLVDHLKHVLADYKPWEAEPGEQHELFVSTTQTATPIQEVSGQMP